MIFILQYWQRILFAAVVAIYIWLNGYVNGVASEKSAQATAIAKQKEEARPKIIDAGREYAKIRDKIIYVKGDNGLAGHRTELAIDSLP